MFVRSLSTFALALALTATGANAQATAGADAGASAGSSASVDGGTLFGGSSVGSAYCTDGVAIGPIAISRTLRPCVAAEIARDAGQLGTFTRGEVRSVQLEALDRLGYGLRTVQQTTASSRNTTPSPVVPPARDTAEPIVLMVRGERFELVGLAAQAWNACEIQQVQLDAGPILNIQHPSCENNG